MTQRAEVDAGRLSGDAWAAIGLSNRMQALSNKMWDALVEKHQHVTVYADGELLGELDFDFRKECR